MKLIQNQKIPRENHLHLFEESIDSVSEKKVSKKNYNKITKFNKSLLTANGGIL